MNFQQKLEESIKKTNSLVCVGLDPDFTKIPKHLLTGSDPVLAFNKGIIDATHDLVSCYKANIAFYLASDIDGLANLKKTIDYLHKQHPDVPLILDGKWADIGNTAEAYAKAAFDILKADAVTVNPYLGHDAVEPFLSHKEKGIFVLCRTSNPGSSDFQDIQVHPKGGSSLPPHGDRKPFYLFVAEKVVNGWNKNNNCSLVVGASAEEIGRVREIVGDMFLLVPGVGMQGGDLKNTVKAGITESKSGLIIHAARSIIYADSSEQFADVAKQKTEELRNQINQYR